MALPPPDGSFSRLVELLQQAGDTPVVVRGNRHSGKSAMITAAARHAGLEVIPFEASRLAQAAPAAGGIGMRRPVDDALAFTALHDGEPMVVVVDNLDSTVVADIEPVLPDLEAMARRIPVIVVTENDGGFRRPPHWPEVEHGPADAVVWWEPRRATLRVLQGGLDV
jgi:hypothetical protein